VDSLLALNISSMISLNNDSIDVNSCFESHRVLDAPVTVFYIIVKGSAYRKWSYIPEKYLEYCPTKDLRLLVDFRTRLESLLKE
jgi:hypothetical protein